MVHYFPIKLGNQSAIWGKTMMSAITKKPKVIKGIEERKTSVKLTSGGANAFIV